MSDTAKWKVSDSFIELCDLKLDLLREKANFFGNNKKYDDCIHISKYYELFNIDNSTNISWNKKEQIANILNYYFDVNWINKDDVAFENKDNKLIIKNSKNNSIEILMNNSESAKMKLSDGRSYEFRIKYMNGSKYIYDTNSIISFLAKDIPPKGSIIYYYDIKPKKPGTFNTETMVRLYDSSFIQLPDISSTIPIEIKESIPNFEISPKPNKLLLICGNPIRMNPDWIEVKYGITYIGGASEPNCGDISIEFDKPENNSFYYTNENGLRNDSLCNRSCFTNYSNFYKYETKEVSMRVVYPNVGTYSLPGIWINGVHHTFEDERISVESFWARNMQYFLLFLTLISLILTAVEIHIARESIPDRKPVSKNTIAKLSGIYIFILAFMFIIIIILLGLKGPL